MTEAELAPHTYRIVVGVSGTSGSPSALRWAAAEAAIHHGEVIAVRAWRPPRPSSSVGGRPPLVNNPAGTTFEQAKRQLNDDIAAVLGDAHQVQALLVHGGRRQILVAASIDADLLVIDAPRRTAPSDSPWLARRLIYRAHCPVVVMPMPLVEAPDSRFVSAGKSFGRGLLRAAGTAGRPGVRAPIVTSPERER